MCPEVGRVEVAPHAGLHEQHQRLRRAVGLKQFHDKVRVTLQMGLLLVLDSLLHPYLDNEALAHGLQRVALGVSMVAILCVLHELHLAEATAADEGDGLEVPEPHL